MRSWWRHVCYFVFVGGVVCGWIVPGWSEEPVTPIDSLLINPQAIHRKTFKIEGMTKDVAMHSGIEGGSKKPLCGAECKLQDSTGTIDVQYIVRCQAGDKQPFTVVAGQRVVVEGNMEAPSTISRPSEGKTPEFWIQALTIYLDKK
ncbi:MAG: hypothetical protein OEV08_02360 [Nitrospira sp.]|nr:hypothetical protein [Nitrospira sp.]